MKHILIFLTACLSFTQQTLAQSNNTEAALYNVGLGSVFGGIGAVINKKPNEKFGKTFLKGIQQRGLENQSWDWKGYVQYKSSNIFTSW